MAGMAMHWYCFSYNGKDLDTGRDCSACTYVGYQNKGINKAMIEHNKAGAGVAKNAVLISVSYLDYCTREEFLAGEEG